MSKNKYVSAKQKAERMANNPDIMRPCPFCGKIPKIIKYGSANMTFYEIACANENCIEMVRTGEKISIKIAKEGWNSRA